MKTFLYICFLSTFATTVFGTSVRWTPLKVLVQESDHVIVAKITDVDAIDMEGNILVSDSTESGLGSGNIFRLHIQVSSVLTEKKVPENILVRLAADRILTLGSYKDLVKNNDFIFLLKGDEFLPVISGYFLREMTEKDEILGLLAK